MSERELLEAARQIGLPGLVVISALLIVWLESRVLPLVRSFLEQLRIHNEVDLAVARKVGVSEDELRQIRTPRPSSSSGVV